ncbi:MAG TPA: tetratricopeptide repeat protein [Bryobacteraceae bacterium]
MAVSSAGQQAFSRDEVRRFLNLSERQLRSWEEQGFITVRTSFGFPELLALRTLMHLRTHRVSPGRIKDVLEALRLRIGDGGDPLTELRIYVDPPPPASGRKRMKKGKPRIRVDIAGRTMEPQTGQLLLDFKGPELDKLLAFPGRSKRSSQDLEELQHRAEAERWFERAIALERTAAPIEEVREAYEKTLELDPQSTGALVNLGTIFFNARSFVKAEKFYARAIEADPEYALAHFNLGNLYDEKGEREKAREHYERALAINPSYSDAHYNLGLLHQNMGQPMKAVHHWKAYLKLDPASTWATIARRELARLKDAAIVKPRSG